MSIKEDEKTFIHNCATKLYQEGCGEIDLCIEVCTRYYHRTKNETRIASKPMDIKKC
jgi:hypothetical protein